MNFYPPLAVEEDKFLRIIHKADVQVGKSSRQQNICDSLVPACAQGPNYLDFMHISLLGVLDG